MAVITSYSIHYTKLYDGAWVPILLGQAAMASGLFALAAFADTVTVPALVALMVPVGVGAGMAMPSATCMSTQAPSYNFV